MPIFKSRRLKNTEVLNLRSLQSEDAQACLNLIPATASDSWSLANIESALDGHQHYFCIGAELGGHLVAFAIFSEVLDEMELLYIAVKASHARRGIAEALLSEVFSLKKNQVEKIHLEVRESNTSAISLYQKLGFIKVGKRKNYYASADKQEDALLFSLTLSEAKN